MADLLTDALPTVWEGRRIDPDFRHMVRLLNGFLRAGSDDDKLTLLRQAEAGFYRDPVPPAEEPEALEGLLRFLTAPGQDTPGRGSADPAPGVLPFDYAADAPYILAAFRQLYGMDLTCEQVHWWLFRALLQGALAEECLFARIVYWRTADTSGMTPERRQDIEEKRSRFALPDGLKGVKRNETLQDHEEAFLARFAR